MSVALWWEDVAPVMPGLDFAVLRGFVLDAAVTVAQAPIAANLWQW